MVATVESPIDTERCLRSLLLDLMMSRSALPWPGADGMTVEEVLGAYAAAAEQGRVPGERELLRRHPELAPAIRTFFAAASPAAWGDGAG